MDSDAPVRRQPQRPAAAKTPARLARLRAAAPWLCAAVVLALVFRGIRWPELLSALARVPAVEFALLVLVSSAAALLCDAWATTVAFRRLRTPLPFAALLDFRGATYLLSLINYGVGQGGLVYFIARTRRASAARAGGVVLFVMGSTLVALGALASAAVLRSPAPALRWYRIALLATALALLPYAAVVLARPRRLSERSLLAPLFEGGLAGQALAVLARMPHLIVLLVGNFLALRLFGVEVPAGAALTYLPIVFLVSAVPVTPQGLGTTQLAALAFFPAWAHGGPDVARAAVAAYSLCYQIGSMAAQALLGLYFLRRTTRRLAGIPRDEAQSPAAWPPATRNPDGSTSSPSASS